MPLNFNKEEARQTFLIVVLNTIVKLFVLKQVLSCIFLLAFLPQYVVALEKNNVVIFLVDDMGLMDTSVPFLTDQVGESVEFPLNRWYQTPNMEKFASKGVRFNQFYAQSVCSPSRISLMTGENATRHHTTQWTKPDINNRGKKGPAKWN